MSGEVRYTESDIDPVEDCLYQIEEVIDTVLSGPQTPADIADNISEENPFYVDMDLYQISPTDVEIPTPSYSKNENLSEFDTVKHENKPSEPENMMTWRIEREKMLEDRDSAENERKKILAEEGSNQYETWFHNYNEVIQKKKKENRISNEMFFNVDSIEKRKIGFTSSTVPLIKSSGSMTEEDELSVWEYVAKLCDLNPNNRNIKSDVTRMRLLMLQLKREKFSWPKVLHKS